MSNHDHEDEDDWEDGEDGDDGDEEVLFKRMKRRMIMTKKTIT